MNVIRLRLFGFTILDAAWGALDSQDYFAAPHPPKSTSCSVPPNRNPMALLNKFIDFDPIVDRLWVKFEPRLDEWRADAMKMLSEALPEMAGKIAEQAVLTTFEHTQVDEAADAVSGVITDIVSRLPRFPFMFPAQR